MGAINTLVLIGSSLTMALGVRFAQRSNKKVTALMLALTAEDLLRIEQAVPLDAVAGERYAAALMETLDSERYLENCTASALTDRAGCRRLE